MADDAKNMNWCKLLLHLRDGKKGAFITTDEGRVVFIGGPSSGGGGASAAQITMLGPGAQLDKEQLNRFDDQIEEWQSPRKGSAFFAMIGVKNGQGVILTEDDQLKGIAGFTSHRNSLHLDNLATKEPGYGKKMMQELAKEAVNRRTGLSWESLSEAVGFYNAIGFAPYGTDGFYSVGYKDLQQWLGGEQ